MNSQQRAIGILAILALFAFTNMSGKGGLIDLLIYRAPALLIALTFHELFHGLAAFLMGDPTAKQDKRLSLNPLRHLDPMGTLMMFVTGGFGWAKPVSINMRNFKYERLGLIFVSLAGPFANFLLAFICIVAYTAFDGFHLGVPNYFLKLLEESIVLNLVLGVFNLIPIPPLDGSKVLVSFLPPRQRYFFLTYEFYGMILLIFLSYMGIFSAIISPMVGTVIKLFSQISKVILGL